MTIKDLRTINIEEDRIDNLFDQMWALINREENENTRKQLCDLFEDCADAYDEVRITV